MSDAKQERRVSKNQKNTATLLSYLIFLHPFSLLQAFLFPASWSLTRMAGGGAESGDRRLVYRAAAVWATGRAQPPWRTGEGRRADRGWQGEGQQSVTRRRTVGGAKLWRHRGSRATGCGRRDSEATGDRRWFDVRPSPTMTSKSIL